MHKMCKTRFAHFMHMLLANNKLQNTLRDMLAFTIQVIHEEILPQIVLVSEEGAAMIDG